MKLNLTTGILIASLTAFNVGAIAGGSVNFLNAITGQAEPTVQNVQDSNPGKNLASQHYIRSITGAVDRITPTVYTEKVSVANSVKLYTNQFENKRAVN